MSSKLTQTRREVRSDKISATRIVFALKIVEESCDM